MLASISGLSLLLHTSALAFQGVKFAGALYLLYLAWSMWREKDVLEFDSSCEKRGMWQIALRGMLINILNPKLSIFFLAFLPLFVPADAASPTLQLALLSDVFMEMTLCIFVLYGVFAHSVRAYVASSPKMILGLQRSFAVVFALLGAKLAISEQ